jgi:hypothetical protein
MVTSLFVRLVSQRRPSFSHHHRTLEDWGDEPGGKYAIKWWCTSNPDAFGSEQPV